MCRSKIEPLYCRVIVLMNVLSCCVYLRVLHPHYRIPDLKLWSSHYLNRYRYDHVHDASKAAEIQALKLVELYKVQQ